MTDASLPPISPPVTPAPVTSASDRARNIRAIVESRLKTRHASERRFKLYGQMAIAIALAFLVILLGRIVTQGASTFVTHSISIEVPLDPARIDTSYLEGVNFDLLVADAVLAKLGEKDDDFGNKSTAVKDLISPDFGFQLLGHLVRQPGAAGNGGEVLAHAVVIQKTSQAYPGWRRRARGGCRGFGTKKPSFKNYG